jgi:acyl carrier protein
MARLTQDNTKKKVTEIIVEILGCDHSEVTPTARLDDLGADSLDMAELWMAIEEEFVIECILEEAEKLQTVNDVLELVGSRITK